MKFTGTCAYLQLMLDEIQVYLKELVLIRNQASGQTSWGNIERDVPGMVDPGHFG